MKKNILFVAALASAMIWTACQKEEKGIEKPEERTDVPTWTLTVQATKTNDAQTKALNIVTENNKERLDATWSAANDHVFVYYKPDATTPWTQLEGQLNVVDGDGTDTATLSGDITGDLTGVNQLTLVFPRTEWNYSTQYGLLKDDENSIERKFDYALATIDVTNNNGTLTASAAEFENQQSIYRFSFKYGGVILTAKNVVLSSANDKIVATYNPFTEAKTYSPITLSMATATTDPVYAAIKHDDKEDDTFHFTVIDNEGVTYKGSKEIPGDAFNQGFVSGKISLGQRLDAALINTEVETVL